NGTAAGTVGTPTTSDHWIFPGPRTATDSTTWVAITNPGQADAKVTVQAVPSTKEVVAPVTVSVAPDGVERVQIGACATADSRKECADVSPGTRYSLDVRADEGIQVVAQLLERGDNLLAAPLGVIASAQSWTFAVNDADGEVDTLLSVFDAQAAPAT